MATNVNETRQMQLHTNPGYMPDEVSFVEGIGTRPMAEIIRENQQQAAEILARWEHEDDDNE